MRVIYQKVLGFPGYLKLTHQSWFFLVQMLYFYLGKQQERKKISLDVNVTKVVWHVMVCNTVEQSSSLTLNYSVWMCICLATTVIPQLMSWTDKKYTWGQSFHQGLLTPLSLCVCVCVGGEKWQRKLSDQGQEVHMEERMAQPYTEKVPSGNQSWLSLHSCCSSIWVVGFFSLMWRLGWHWLYPFDKSPQREAGEVSTEQAGCTMPSNHPSIHPSSQLELFLSLRLVP